ncbi:Phytoene synthase [bacterium HR21]|nr:Phytoene synthase [bacterium HR21]
MPLGLHWEELSSLCQPDGGSFRVRSRAEASRFCRRWTRRHAENFPVASLLLPRRTRPHVTHLYAFARLADDIADHPEAPAEEKLALLQLLEESLQQVLRRQPSSGNPILLALADTLQATRLPQALLRRLLVAFRYDAAFRPFPSWEELFWYCHHSANPIGEALLWLHRSCTPKALCASNALCTALQLLNFWQDLSLDLPRGRLYLPRELLKRLELEALALWENPTKLQLCLAEFDSVVANLLQRAERGLHDIGHSRLRCQTLVTLAAAHRLRQRLRQLGSRILYRRPQLGLGDGIPLLIQAWKLRRR